MGNQCVISSRLGLWVLQGLIYLAPEQTMKADCKDLTGSYALTYFHFKLKLVGLVLVPFKMLTG